MICDSPLAARPVVRLERSRLVACPRCGTWHYTPRAAVADQIARHAAAEYLDHPYFRNRSAQTGRIRARCRQVFDEIGRAIDIGSLRGERVLDVGCNTGDFLEAATEMLGIAPLGVDVSGHAVAVARRRGIAAEVSTLESAPDTVRELPVIVAIDVIEHVIDPAGFLRHIAARLKPGGVAYLETPNPRSPVYRLGAFASRLSGGRPASVFERLFPSEHQYYFPASAARLAAEGAGLSVVRAFTRPLPAADTAVSWPVKVLMSGVQAAGAIAGEWTLLCLVLQKPHRA